MYLLRNHRKRFDIAIIEVQQTDSDRLRLLSEIRSEIDIISKNLIIFDTTISIIS